MVERPVDGTVSPGLVRGRRIQAGVALAVTWPAWLAALHDLFCTMGGAPVDLAPTSYAVGAIVVSSLGIGGLSSAIILSCQRWQFIAALVCTLVLMPWLVVQLLAYPALEYTIWYSLTIAAVGVVTWQVAWSLQLREKAR